MSNKTQLQANNIELQGIIDIIQELPEAIPDELGSAITTDVLIGKTFTSDSGIMQQGGLDPETLKTGIYVWKKLTAEGGDFVDFVVNDTETAYPDGGMQEGYWYEKVVEGITGIDYGTVTLASSGNLEFSHNLGKVPSHVIVVATTFNSSNFGASYDSNGVGAQSPTTMGSSSFSVSVEKSSGAITVESNWKWPMESGLTYYWFAIA